MSTCPNYVISIVLFTQYSLAILLSSIEIVKNIIPLAGTQGQEPVPLAPGPAKPA
jgi:hypothetical protein